MSKLYHILKKEYSDIKTALDTLSGINEKDLDYNLERLKELEICMERIKTAEGE